jgi:VIT1/CCC1 family predicted Fe2+/Mn2+ transporter
MPRALTLHPEGHASHRVGWLRAGVLGANDGIVSTASLLLGVAAADASRGIVLTTGVAALAAGAFSMAVGEYVSVSSQRDAEQADIAKERHELERFPEHELDELTGIYMAKGLTPELAREVAVELSKGDQLAVHMVEELGITEATLARPVQASLTSAASFAVGALIPLVAILIATTDLRIGLTAAVSVLALGILGAVGARLGGAPVQRATVRVVVGGVGAMALTTLIGRLLGTAVG